VGGRSRERRAAQKALMDLTAVESERRAALKSLANALEMQRGQLLGDRKLVDRLAGLGVFLSFPEDESSLVHTLEVIDSLRDAFPHETAFRRVQAALAGRFFLKALLDMERDRVQATKVARRELLDEETKQRGVVRREVRRLLAAATAAESTGRTHKAFEPLAEIRLRLDWTRPALRHDPEIRDIADRATRKFLLLGELSFEEGTLAQRWRDARSLSDAILLRAEELVDGMTQAARYRGRAVVGGRADAVDACREEVERLFAVAREALKAGDTAVVNSSVRQGQSILEWVLVEPPPEYRSFLKIFETEKSTVPGLKQG
jgi:hypothetical protein